MASGADPLRPAQELAFDVARLGAAARPPVPAPAPLRPYLRFTRLTAPVLDAVRRVVEGDDEFRRRVALLADAAEIGRAGQLWLERPDGWEGELRDLLDAEAHEAEPSAREIRRRERARAARARADDELRELRLGAQVARDELAAERAARSEAEHAASAAVAENVRLADDRSEAVRRLKEAEARAADAATERNALRRRLRELEEAARGASREGPSSTAAAPPDPTSAPPLDRAAMADAMRAAASAAAALARALEEVARTIAVAPRPAGPRDSADDVVPAPARAPAPREAAPLPGGVLDDSADAAEHLLRVKGAVLLVDGYNVTKAAWPDLPPAEQRARLVQALGTLTARTGIEVDVVFDGADVVTAAPLLSPRGVRVRYSDPGTEADDVLIDLVDEYPASRAVVAASSDGRVREGARRRGANLLHARQLLAAIRR